MKRILIALGIAAAIYGIALGSGSLLYGTGAIATGATHNNCVNIKKNLAAQQGVAEDDVSQSDIKNATQSCLDGHELSKGDAFRSEYLFWSAWPAAICALIFLLWPVWARALHNQELTDELLETKGT